MKTKLRKLNRLLAVTIALTAVLTSGFNVAGPIVTEWSFSSNATFTAASFGSGSGSTNGGTALPVEDYELSWGAVNGDFENPTGTASNNRSAMTIGVPGSLTGGGSATGDVKTVIGGGIPTGAEIGLGVNITHWNNPLSGAFATLTGGTIFDTLTLTPKLPFVGSAVSAPDITFDFNFAETPNGGPCASGTPAPCGDLFGIFGTPTLNLMFSYDANDYLASILLSDGQGGASPLGALTDDQCTAISFGSGCIGFLTSESQATTLQFAFAVSTDPIFDVPEPATLALFGLGVFGMGYCSRRKAAQQHTL
ncbi:MAG: THxN family PEP-CTERM protein [Colwellia sp.]|nr:THxN family PEP-CTERM protein [Colwellia sp.]